MFGIVLILRLGIFDADRYECIKDVMVMAGIYGANGTVLTTALSPLLESCIRGKGWKKETHEERQAREDRNRAKDQAESISHLLFIVESIITNPASTKPQIERIKIAGQEGLKILYDNKNLLTLPPEKFKELRDGLKSLVETPEKFKDLLDTGKLAPNK